MLSAVQFIVTHHIACDLDGGCDHPSASISRVRSQCQVWMELVAPLKTTSVIFVSRVFSHKTTLHQRNILLHHELPSQASVVSYCCT